MPFVTKKPSHYFAALAQDSTESLHVGLYFGGSISDDTQNDFKQLGRMIQQTARTIQCLWLRFRDGDESVVAAFGVFGNELIGSMAILSLVFEGRLSTPEVRCLSGFLTCNELRGIQFRRTDVDVSTFSVLKPFFSQTNTLKVLDLSANPGFGDECVTDVLHSLLDGGAPLESISIGEKFDGIPDERRLLLSHGGISLIATYISKTSSLLSITLHLIHLDDIRLGEIANAVKKSGCNLRRLDFSGDFGNSGINIFAEALKMNTSVRTITLGCYRHLNDLGGQYLLNVVDPFSKPALSKEEEWEEVDRSNHTLQSIYILPRPLVTVNDELVTKLRSISLSNPHRTYQRKCWLHLEKNLDDISHLGLESKHMPEVLSFVNQHGSLDHIFRMIRSRSTPELFTYPSPEKARLSYQMKQLESENQLLKDLLDSERAKAEEDRHETKISCPCWILTNENAKKCWLLPWIKIWELLVELFGFVPAHK